MGRRSFLISFTGFCFGRGVTSANFQILGSRCSLKEADNMTDMGYGRNSAYSLNTQLGIPLGPPAFAGLRGESLVFLLK